MRQSDSQRVKEVFVAALAVEGTARATFLDGACSGDHAIRREVEALLAADSSASAELYLEHASPLRLAVSETTANSRTTDSRVGEQVGPYTLIKLLGRGGMGEVYLAERSQPFVQQVAIKLLKRGMDSEAILHRFRNEVQFLAAVGKHPHIVGVSDAGMTADDLPYFVMEYIEGETIDSYCSRKTLQTEDILGLFAAVCHAVQFAHQSTLLHRDLKPSNILVTQAGEPRLIDFGIAKLTEVGPEQPTMSLTRPGESVMTPEYASPEQVRGEPLTTASDIYSLGIVLYELLTGHRPYEFESRSPREVIEVVCNRTPAKPSTAVREQFTTEVVASTETKATQAAVATGGQISGSHPHRLSRRLRGDVDNIVLKSLHKDPQRRYESVSQFAADIERHLTGLPVLARPDTLGYRVSKLVLRHKLVAAATAAVLLAIVAGSISTTIAWRRAEAEAERAHQETQRTEVSLQLARQTIFDFMTKASESTGILAEAPGTQQLRARLFANAAEQFERIIDEIGDSSQDRAELARSLFWLGYIQTDLGKDAAAQQAYLRSVSEWDRLLTEFPHDKQYVAERARAHNNLGLLMISFEDRQQQAEGENFLRQAIASRQQLLEDDPANRNLMAAIARTLVNLGRRMRSLEQPEKAERYYDQAREINRKLLDKDPHHAGYRIAVSQDHMQLGQSLLLTDTYRPALSEFQKALELLRPLYQEDALLNRESLTMGLYHAAWMHRLLKEHDQALALYAEARPLAAQLVRDNPDVAKYRENLALIYNGIAAVYLSRNQHALAIDPLESAVQIGEQLVAASPELLVHKRTTVQARYNLATAYANMERFEEAAATGRQVVADLDELIAANPTTENQSIRLASLTSMAGHWTRLNRRDQAEEAYLEAISGLEQLVADHPGGLQFSLMLGAATCNHGGFLQEGRSLGRVDRVL